jgi:hypothetical protein
MDAKEPLRLCSRTDKSKKRHKREGGRCQICIPMTRDEYDAIWSDPAKVRSLLLQNIADNPELFPANIKEGFSLAGMLPESRKQPGVRLRQLITKNKAKWSVRPSFVTPYMTAQTQDLDGPLLLISLGVPLWAICHVFGRDEMYWYRIVEQLGRNSIVGTTVQSAEQLPDHLAADEHHTDWCGEKGYVAMTAAQGCILGISLTDEADESHLSVAYGVFAQEAKDLKEDYQPKSVNTDGWWATQNAFISLFPGIAIVLCFLHGFLKVRDRCFKEFELHKKIWEVYSATSGEDFRKKMGEFKAWFSAQTWKAYVVEMTSKLWKRTEEYSVAYDQPGCYRTSNQVDRPMNRIKRILYSGRGLHGHRVSSERHLRGVALLNNFRPFAPRSKRPRQFQSPANRLSGKLYSKSWVENLVLAASLRGYKKHT